MRGKIISRVRIGLTAKIPLATPLSNHQKKPLLRTPLQTPLRNPEMGVALDFEVLFFFVFNTSELQKSLEKNTGKKLSFEEPGAPIQVQFYVEKRKYI